MGLMKRMAAWCYCIMHREDLDMEVIFVDRLYLMACKTTGEPIERLILINDILSRLRLMKRLGVFNDEFIDAKMKVAEALDEKVREKVNGQ